MRLGRVGRVGAETRPSRSIPSEKATRGTASAVPDTTRPSRNGLGRVFESCFILADCRPLIGLPTGTTNNSWRTAQVNQSDTGISSVPKQVKMNGTSPDYAAVRPSSTPATVEPTTAPHPKSYMEIMEMVRRGERPPNIREINDMPPNPNQQPTKPVLAPRAKPWEVPQQKPSYAAPPPPQPSAEGLSYGNEENRLSSDPNGKAHDSSESWWKKKTVKITEIEPESEELRQQPRQQPFPYNNDHLAQRSWVPPQPPSVVIPESAAAIRQPKKQQQPGEMARSDDREGSVASDDTRVDPAEASAAAGVFAESSRNEIEEEQEGGIAIS